MTGGIIETESRGRNQDGMLSGQFARLGERPTFFHCCQCGLTAEETEETRNCHADLAGVHLCLSIAV